MYSDYLLIIFIATCTAVVGEALTYILVYRSEQYKRLKNEMERKTKKLERKKETTAEADRTAKRKIDREEERLKATNRDMSNRDYSIYDKPQILPVISELISGDVEVHISITAATWIWKRY
uniref:Uncharacterized protein n=1 Tax=Setaria digitata TaxID=48799 RepID=A0A915Q6W7_9BILA